MKRISSSHFFPQRSSTSRKVKRFIKIPSDQQEGALPAEVCRLSGYSVLLRLCQLWRQLSFSDFRTPVRGCYQFCISRLVAFQMQSNHLFRDFALSGSCVITFVWMCQWNMPLYAAAPRMRHYNTAWFVGWVSTCHGFLYQHCLGKLCDEWWIDLTLTISFL